MKDREKIVAFGGGTGLPTTVEAILKTGIVNNVNTIVTPFDSGGETGKRRNRAKYGPHGDQLAYSDINRTLVSLFDPFETNPQALKRAEIIRKWLTYKNGDGEVPGYGIAHSSFDPENGFKILEEEIEGLGINLMGRVLPASPHASHIKFWTESGREFIGEHHLDDEAQYADVVVRMVLDPEVPAYIPATEAIKKAQLIILSPGSMHGSLLCNFLPDGMRAAMASTKAKIMAVTNLTSTRNENHEFSLNDYMNLIYKYTGVMPHMALVPDISRAKFEETNPGVTALYNRENSHFLGWEDSELYRAQSDGIQIVTHHATSLVEVKSKGKTIVRHDPEKLAESLKELVS